MSGEGLYSNADNYAPFVREGVDRVAAALELGADERAAYVDEVAGLFSDAGVPPQEATLLHGLLANAIVQPVGPEQRREWREKVEADAAYGFGRDEFARRLERVNAYLATRPLVRDMLADSGMGNHPRIVQALLVAAPRLPVR